MKILKTLITAVMLVSLITMSAGISSAAVILTPDDSFSGTFDWNDDGNGWIDKIATDASSQTWSITTLIPTTLNIDVVDDQTPWGDEFELYINGALVNWTSSVEISTVNPMPWDNPTYLKYFLEDYLLEGGATYTITLNVLKVPTADSGRGYANITTATPIPGAVWLLGSGLLGLVGFRKRNKFFSN